MSLKKINLFGLFFIFFGAQYALAMPAEVLLMRHGEKPVQGNELSPQGWERAQALPSLFQRPEFQKYGQPAALYAMAPSDIDGSLRAIETLQFVSRDLKLVTNSQFTKNQVAELIDQIRNDHNLDGRMIVICWEHNVLRDIARQFGLLDPPRWPGQQFDRIWRLNFSSQGDLLSFQDLPEKLLPNDSQN